MQRYFIVFSVLVFSFFYAFTSFADSKVMGNKGYGISKSRCHIKFLNDKNNGETIQLQTGTIIIVALNSNPSTGYDWYIEELDENIVEYKNEIYIPTLPVMIGSPGKKILFFRANETGETDLVLEYYMVLGSDSNIDSYTIHFDIQ